MTQYSKKKRWSTTLLVRSLLSKRSYTLPLLLMLFNSADTFFTVLALERGATEFNIVMALVLTFGTLPFLFVKLIVVNLLILFVGLIGRRYLTGRIGLSIAVCAYTLLACYHIVNLSLLYLTASAL